MKVRATADGVYRGSRKRPGDVFDLRPGDKMGQWMVKIVARPATVLVAEEPPAPETFSAITKQTEKERNARAQKKGIPTEVLDAESVKG